jgi:hypothetical protein
MLGTVDDSVAGQSLRDWEGSGDGIRRGGSRCGSQKPGERVVLGGSCRE